MHDFKNKRSVSAVIRASCTAILLTVLFMSDGINFAQESLPDLTITDISINSASPKPGDFVTIKVTVQNIGTGDFKSSYDLCFGLELASAQVAKNYRAPINNLPMQTLNLPRLASGASNVIEMQWRVIDIPRVKLKFKVDCGTNPGTESNESNEKNNEAEKLLLIEEKFLDQWWLDQIDAHKAQEIAKGNPGVLVAVVDTGVDRTHPELQDHTIMGYDFIDKDDDSLKGSEIHHHGTGAAGLISAAADGVGVTGVAPSTKILDVRAANTAGVFLGGVEFVNPAIRFAVDHGAKVINYSGGGPTDDRDRRAGIEYLLSKGVIMVASAGEDAVSGGSNRTKFPAAYPEVIAVAATDRQGRLTKYSNFGREVTVAAPGGDLEGIPVSRFLPMISSNFQKLVPLLNQMIIACIPGGTYAWDAGTSSATAIVSGVVALMLSVNPRLTGEQVKKILRETATPLKSTFGLSFGIVNAAKAVQAAKDSAGK